MSGNGGAPSGEGSSTPGQPKAIGSLAKKQSDVTRLGAQKMKFTPTLPTRRKKETEVKQEPTAAPIPAAPSGGRGRGRGRGGEGRGGAPRGAPPVVEMTASGPFAMGPALTGSSAARRAPRSNFAPVAPLGTSALGAGLSATGPPSLAREAKGKGKEKEEGGPPVKKEDTEEEVYSDPDEGVEIVDMDDVKRMDWMAPESLAKEKKVKKKKKKVMVVKEEAGGADANEMDVEAATAAGEVDLANAVDLSESEEEEELEDIIDDFALQAETLGGDTDLRAERLYFFQFPEPFPTFVSPSAAASIAAPAAVTLPPASEDGTKKVSFAEDTKPAAPGIAPTASGATTTTSGTPEPVRLNGSVGHLEIYQSGAVKIRFGNGIVMDVTAATQPSFLTHAVHVDVTRKRLSVLGEVNKRFIATPDVEMLLADLEVADGQAGEFGLQDPGLLRMDES